MHAIRIVAVLRPLLIAFLLATIPMAAASAADAVVSPSPSDGPTDAGIDTSAVVPEPSQSESGTWQGDAAARRPLPTGLPTDKFVADAPPRAEPLPPPPVGACPGPAPCVPLHVFGPHHRGGFLYYGTCARDDDPFNSHWGCYSNYANCAPIGTWLGEGWIRWHRSAGSKAHGDDVR